jgi:hypothetical protein
MKFYKLIKITAAFAISALVIIAAAEADTQVESPYISGTVIDANTVEGIAGAKVTIEETGQTTTANDYGNYSFEEVESGVYTLKAEADGYQSSETTVEVNDDNVTVDIALEAAPDFK